MQSNQRQWLLCGLLFAAATLNYVDRQILAILSASPEFRARTRLGPVEYGYAHALFQIAYALALVLGGRLVDAVGTRRGYAIVMAVWSLADMAHSLARGATGFFVARFTLGLGEGGNFPTAIKVIGERYAQQQRAFVTGIFNAGTSVGALSAPLLVPWLYAQFGWRGPFLLTGLAGFVWIAGWLAVTGRPPASTAWEPAPRPIGWRELLGDRNMWAIAIGKGLTDPIWFFYLAWLPAFLGTRHGVHIGSIGWPLAAIYLLSDAGSVGGGWVAGWLMRRGFSVAAARRRVMLVAALLAVPTLLVPRLDQLWWAVLLVGLATAGHQAWSANLFTLASDLMPPRAVGRIVGIAGMVGALGGAVFAALAGHAMGKAGGERMLFVAAGSMYLVAWVVLRFMLQPTYDTKRIPLPDGPATL